MRSKFKWIFSLLLAFSMQFSFAQEKTITGTITEKGLPLPGVTISVKGTTKGTQSDFDGKYSLSVAVGQVLEFSYIGYKTQTATVGASNSINMTMVESEATGLETVVINQGYKSTTQRKSASAVSSISIDAIEERANASVIQNLQGQIAGLNIGTGSGQPGADSTIILRGVGSIQGNIEPLFVVDGIPVDEDGFRTINQNDINTITVLKDAAATSIYGNRGGNGVVVVTTKRAKSGESLKVRYTSQFGITELQGLNIELMNSKQILNLQKSAGSGLGSTLSDAEINAIAGQTDTYWTDVFFRKGVTKSHDLSMTSGTERTSNYSSLGYFEQDGIFINSDFKRFNIRNNFSGRSENDKFNYTLNFAAGFSRSRGNFESGTFRTYFNPFLQSLTGLPYVSALDPDGSITTDGGIEPGDDAGVNPTNAPIVLLNSAKMNQNQQDELKILASLSANYKITKNLTAGIQMGADYSGFQTLRILHPNSLLGPFQIDPRALFGGIQQEGSTRDFRFNTTLSLNFNKTFAEKHTLDLTAYTEYYKAHYDGINFTARGLDPRLIGTGSAFVSGTTIDDYDLNPATPNQPYIPTIGSFKTEEGLFSYFGNLQYDYDSKYVFTGSIRRDASFRFVDDNKWGTFWSVGGAWNMDQEAFLKDKSVFNMLKLRASYGTSGNQRILNAQYSALNFTRSLYGVANGYNGSAGTAAAQLGNIDLQWEELKQLNIGFDFGVWKNRLTGSIDVYNKTTEQLFQEKPISLINGTGSIDANIGSMENRGIEANFKYVVYDKNGWNISVNANASYNKNKILELPSSYEGINFNGQSTALIEGESIGTFYLVRYQGVNPSNGNPLFLDANGNLTENLREEDRVSTGKSIYPVFQGGFGTNVAYKGFEFSTQWSWLAEVYRSNFDLAVLEDTNIIGNDNNRSTSVLNAWTNPGDITDIPRFGTPFASGTYSTQTDRYLEDASFLRLRNISFGYSFSKDQLKNTPLTGLKFFIQGENLLTFSKYRGWDAESNYRSGTAELGNYPTPKIYTFGATINF